MIANGYNMVRRRGHPRATKRGHVYEHILVAEAALGKHLPLNAEVHHVDENKRHNDGGNLVICPDRAYHMLLHKRMRAMAACGDANALRCSYCSGYDRQDEIVSYRKGNAHLSCGREAFRSRQTRTAA